MIERTYDVNQFCVKDFVEILQKSGVTTFNIGSIDKQNRVEMRCEIPNENLECVDDSFSHIEEIVANNSFEIKIMRKLSMTANIKFAIIVIVSSIVAFGLGIPLHEIVGWFIVAITSYGFAKAMIINLPMHFKINKLVKTLKSRN